MISKLKNVRIIFPVKKTVDVKYRQTWMMKNKKKQYMHKTT